jgi:cardiolipin synthase
VAEREAEIEPTAIVPTVGREFPRRRAPLAAPAPDPRSYVPDPSVAIGGNRVRVLQDGVETYPAMLEAIARARRSVYLETYIFNDDRTGRMFAEALRAAAARGLDVGLLYDSLGSWRTPARLFLELATRGVKVLAYKPLAPWRRGWGWARRDHRKQLLLDGSVGFTGGINIGDQWAHADQGGLAWHDTMVEIAGPAVTRMEALFREVWRKEARRQRLPLRLRPRAPGRPAPPPPAAADEAHEDVDVWIVGNREYARRRSIRKAYRFAVARARRYVFIANAYFVPDHAILRALRRARERGVRVVLVLPGASDLRAVQWASRATYDRLLSWGIEILHWCPPVFHAKTAVIDGAWSTVGSYNLDTQSLRYNLEITSVFLSRRVGARLERIFADDFLRCERVDLARWRARPGWWRIPERLCYALRAWL